MFVDLNSILYSKKLVISFFSYLKFTISWPPNVIYGWKILCLFLSLTALELLLKPFYLFQRQTLELSAPFRVIQSPLVYWENFAKK